MSFFSGFIYNVWGNTFGWELLTMRYFAIAVQLFALICCGVFLWHRIHNSYLSLFIVGMCCFFMNGMFNLSLVGWGAISNCMLVLTMLACIYYISTPRLITLFLFCILTTFSIFTRLPNIIILPISFIFLLVYGYKTLGWKKSIIHSFLYVIIVFILSISLIILFFGSIGNYRLMIIQNTLSEHSLGNLISIYFVSVVGLFTIIGPIWLVYFFIRFAYLNVINKVIRTWILILVLLYFIQYCFFTYTNDYCVTTQIVSFTYFLFLIIHAIWVTLRSNITHTFASKLSQLSSIIVLLVCSIIPIIGSNTGFAKLNSIIILPALLALSIPFFDRKIIIYTIVIALGLGVAVIRNKRNYSYSDEGIKNANCAINVPLLDNIYTTANRAMALNILDKIINLSFASSTC